MSSGNDTATPTTTKAWKTAMRALDTATSVQSKAAMVVATGVKTISDTIAGNAAAAYTAVVPGAKVGDSVIVNPAVGIQGLCIGSCFVDTDDSVTIGLSNPKTVGITLTAVDFDIMVLRKGVN